MFRESSFEGSGDERERKAQKMDTGKDLNSSSESIPDKSIPEAKGEIIPQEAGDIDFEQDGKKRKETELEKYEREIKEKENEAKPEVEEKFRSALASLHADIQKIRGAERSFPSKNELKQLVEQNELFSQMAEGAKIMIAGVLEKYDEFQSPDLEVFIKKGMDILALFIHLETLHKAGEEHLQESLKNSKENFAGVRQGESQEEAEQTPEEI